MKLVQNNSAALVSFPNPDTAAQVIQEVTMSGHFAGLSQISARPYFVRNKGDRKGNNNRKGGDERVRDNQVRGGDHQKSSGKNGSSGPVENQTHRGGGATGSSGPVENQTLESAKISQQKLIKKEVSDKKNVLLTHATERIQLLLQKLSDPSLSAARKEKYGVLLQQFKQKLTLLTASTAPPPAVNPMSFTGGKGGMKGKGKKSGEQYGSWAPPAESWELLVHLKSEVPEEYLNNQFLIVRFT